MKTHLLLAGSHLRRLAEISSMLDPTEYGHVIAQTRRPLPYVCGHSGPWPDGAIVELAGTETLTEFVELRERCPTSCFVFLVDQMPPHAAVARAVGAQGVFLDRRESTLTISATLISLLHQRSMRPEA